MDFLTNEVLTATLLGVLGTKAAAMAIVNTTDTPKDDEIVGKVYRVLELIAGIVVSDRAKQFPGEVTEIMEEAEAEEDDEESDSEE